MLHKEITDKLSVVTTLFIMNWGYGFLEKIYENAMIIALRSEGLNCLQQVRISVYFRKEVVGEYIADIIVNGK